MFKKLSSIQRENSPNDEELLKQAEMLEKLKLEVSQEMGLQKPKANNKKN